MNIYSLGVFSNIEVGHNIYQVHYLQSPLVILMSKKQLFHIDYRCKTAKMLSRLYQFNLQWTRITQSKSLDRQ
jgi:hypothetical protein